MLRHASSPLYYPFATVRLKCNMKLKLWVRCCLKLAAFCWWNFRVNASSALLFWHYSAWKLVTTTANNKGKQQQCTSRNADSPNEQRTTPRIRDALRCASAAMPSGAERLSKRAFLVMGRTSCPCGLRFSNVLPLSDTLWMGRAVSGVCGTCSL